MCRCYDCLILICISKQFKVKRNDGVTWFENSLIEEIRTKYLLTCEAQTVGGFLDCKLAGFTITP